MILKSGAAALAGELTAVLSAFAGQKILIVGDLMLDEYLTGDAQRISPEAPVPIVRVESQSHLLGGAGNVALNIAAMGGTPTIIGLAGDDIAGRLLREGLSNRGIASSLLDIPGRPTTIKTRVLARKQQVIRIDREDTSQLTADHRESLLDKISAQLPDNSAVVLSDYGKGMVSRSLIEGIQSLIHHTRRTIPLLVDPKPENFGLYHGATLLTPNAKETSESVTMPVDSPEEIVAAGREIMRRLELPHLVTTLGSRGMAVFESADSIWHIPTVARQVFDVTGAGDTVIAALSLGLASGASLVASSMLANYAAGLVVSKVGAATAAPEEIASAIESLPPPTLSRWS